MLSPNRLDAPRHPTREAAPLHRAILAPDHVLLANPFRPPLIRPLYGHVPRLSQRLPEPRLHRQLLRAHSVP